MYNLKISAQHGECNITFPIVQNGVDFMHTVTIFIQNQHRLALCGHRKTFFFSFLREQHRNSRARMIFIRK